MSKNVQRFQTFVTRLRPHRVAILTDINDKDWQNTCLRIIENLSQIWGGAHSLIIPTDGNSIDEVFWEMLSSFDPDTLFRYQKSGYDFSRNEPERFEEYVAGEVRKLVEQDYESGYAEREIRASILQSFVEDFHISKISLASFLFASALSISKTIFKSTLSEVTSGPATRSQMCQTS